MLSDLHLYFPLFLVILGFAVLFFGGLVLFKYKKRKSIKKFGGLLMTIGGFMTAILTFVIIWLPTPTEFAIMEMSLFYSTPELFESITVESNSNETTEFFSLIDFTTENRSEIGAVIEALHEAKPFSPGLRNTIWSLRLMLNTRKRQLTMDIDHCGDRESKNGTLLFIHNSMGTYRCDNMGGVLEDILIKRAEAPHKNSWLNRVFTSPDSARSAPGGGLTGSRLPGQHPRL